MYVFIDESGTNKPSGQCVFVAVLIEAHKLADVSDMIEVAEGLSKTNIFHWRGKPPAVREEFITLLSRIDFVARYVVLNSPLKNYNDVLKDLLISSCLGINMTKIIVDGRKSKSYERHLKMVLRSNGVSTKKLKTAADEAYPGIRVADALAGLIRTHSNRPTATSVKLINELRKRGRI
jgi:hypothetical protein